MMNAAAIRADIPLLADNPPHYLDNAATSLMPQAVIDATVDYDARVRANIGRGVYAWAEQSTAHYESARAVVAAALSVPPNEVVFSSGATAALNLIANAIGESLTPTDAVWLATDNHHSNIVPWQIAAARRGFTLNWLPANSFGAPDISALPQALAAAGQKPKVFAISHAANVSGAVTDIQQFAQIAAATDAIVVVDGAQYIPHQLPDISQLGADFYVFSAHKCYAPTGIGVLWGREILLRELTAAVGGGGMVELVSAHNFTCRPPPHKWEAGTPPISQAVALAAAIKWRAQWSDTVAVETHTLADMLRSELQQIAGIKILSTPDGTPLVSFTTDAHPHDICQLLASRRVAARGGHHCAQPLMRHWNINGCTRFSLAPYNTADDVHAAVAATAAARKILGGHHV